MGHRNLHHPEARAWEKVPRPLAMHGWKPEQAYLAMWGEEHGGGARVTIPCSTLAEARSLAYDALEEPDVVWAQVLEVDAR